MNVKELFTDDRAVSPVVGVALLIAITVILAAVIGGVVLGLGTTGADQPQAQLQVDQANDALKHNGGDPLPEGEIVIEHYDSSVPDTLTHTLGGDLTAGDSIDLSAQTAAVEDGDTVRVIWNDPNSDSSTVLYEEDF